jgi:hypothetical protein
MLEMTLLEAGMQAHEASTKTAAQATHYVLNPGL